MKFKPLLMAVEIPEACLPVPTVAPMLVPAVAGQTSVTVTAPCPLPGQIP